MQCMYFTTHFKCQDGTLFLTLGVYKAIGSTGSALFDYVEVL